MAAIIDTGIPNHDQGYVLRMCLCLVGLAAIGFAAAVTAQYFSAHAAIGFAARLRHVLMEHIQGLSYTELDQVGTSTLITRMTSDVNQVQTGVNMALRLLLRSPFVVFGAMIMAFTIDTEIALIFVGVILVLFLIIFGLMGLTIPRYRKVQNQLDTVTAATRENLTGVRVIRAFCQEEQQEERFNGLNQKLTALQLNVGRISAAMNPLTYVVINLAVILLLNQGALKVQAGGLTQGQVVALYNYMSQILVELVKLANLIVTLTKALACANRVSKVLELQSSLPYGTLSPAPDAPRGSVVFDHVSMRYQGAGAEALTDITFSAKPGQTVGIIGGTGSGKSTLVHLIPRFYDTTAGTVSLDGMDVRSLSKEALRRRIAVVPQKAVLFKGTIRSNLLWGNPHATEEDLQQALTVAQALDVVASKDKGLEEEVEQGGRNFSGGQRQRLTIARALVAHPEVLILDDSASALDYATDAALRRAIRTMEAPPTTFIVSQRAASVRFADFILVLDDGRVVGMGTHDELLASCPIYREIYDSQFEKEAK